MCEKRQCPHRRIFRCEKKVAFKMRRCKGYHRKVGHRQELTVVKITDIKL
ncbi:MAG: bL21 family ribosomal protein [Limisphaerales bacterium]